MIHSGDGAAARRAADRLGFIKNISLMWPLQTTAVPADRFDAVISRFGVMFFPAPVHGVREMLRVSEARTETGLAVWHSRNNLFTIRCRVITATSSRRHLRRMLLDASALPSWQATRDTLRKLRNIGIRALCSFQYRRQSHWKTFGRWDRDV